MGKENDPPPKANFAAWDSIILRAPVPKKTDPLSLQLNGSDGLAHLTANSKSHLEGRVLDFAIQVIAEARAIEQREHAGKGLPEVTAAHIDEAFWVVRRRIRRAKHPYLTVVARACEVAGAAGIGVGATLFQAKWGPLIFISSCIVTLAGFVLESFTLRD